MRRKRRTDRRGPREVERGWGDARCEVPSQRPNPSHADGAKARSSGGIHYTREAIGMPLLADAEFLDNALVALGIVSL